jgi:hypothetical protein
MAVLEQILELPEERKNLVLIMLWDWWTTRNKCNAGELERTTEQVCHVVQRHVMEFVPWVKRVLSETPISNNEACSRSGWERPKENLTKVNFDAAFNQSTASGAWGFVA